LGGEHCRVMVRVLVPRSKPVVPTISGVFPAADWHERETYDFYGIHFQDHPNLTRILLPEDADFHPLLKDYMP
jgi:NADH-quinone oxidoreductase subunit C